MSEPSPPVDRVMSSKYRLDDTVGLSRWCFKSKPIRSSSHLLNMVRNVPMKSTSNKCFSVLYHHGKPSTSTQSTMHTGSLESINLEWTESGEESDCCCTESNNNISNAACWMPWNMFNGSTATSPSSPVDGLGQSSGSIISDEFAKSLDYGNYEEIVLYYQLNRMLHSQRTTSSLASGAGERQCTRLVNRFGWDYEDLCKFPLVMPVFNGKMFERRSSSCGIANVVTWQQLMLVADGCLALWEHSAINNLRRRFGKHNLPAIMGRPSDWITMDPNSHLRDLLSSCSTYVDERSIVKYIHKKERHQALKRWSSNEDLLIETNQQKVHDGHWKRNKSSYRTDQCLLISCMEQTKRNDFSRFSSKLSNKQTEKYGQKTLCSSKSFNQLMLSSMKSNLASNWTSRTNKMDKGEQNVLLFAELCCLLEHCSAIHFALFITRFYQDHYQEKINNICMLSSLVLHTQDLVMTWTNWPNDLMDLLRFDDTMVNAIRHYLLSDNEPTNRANCLSNVIEACCLLFQLRNYHALQVVIGAIQSPELYFDLQCWLLLQQNYPIHYKDYRKMCSFTRTLSGPQSMLSCVGYAHIPPLRSILNRLRLYCSTAWNLFDARRRFTERHQSIVDWIGESMSSSASNSYSIKRGHSIHQNHLESSFRHDPNKQTFLGHGFDGTRIITFSEYPEHIQRRRYLRPIPDRYLKWLIGRSAWQTLVQFEMERSFANYQLPDKFY